MANVCKIIIGNACYDIVPQLGEGLKEENGRVSLSLGGGVAINEKGEISLNSGKGFSLNKDNGTVTISMGTATNTEDEGIDTGIDIEDGEFKIYTGMFINYLKSLGVVFK